ncbi:hypothetical protein AAFF_G00342630, partial [Aldrovandia affinis]
GGGGGGGAAGGGRRGGGGEEETRGRGRVFGGEQQRKERGLRRPEEGVAWRLMGRHRRKTRLRGQHMQRCFDLSGVTTFESTYTGTFRPAAHPGTSWHARPERRSLSLPQFTES